MKNRQWKSESPFYVHGKKHFCPVCQGELDVKRVRKVTNSQSDEAKDYDFSFPGGDGFMFGDVEFSFEVFFCTACKKEFSVKEMKETERGKRKETRG